MLKGVTPGLLLAGALATVLLFPGPDRGQFYRAFEHDLLSSDHLTVAANLSPEHGFLQFMRRYLDADGEPAYEPYHRFPPLGYALIRFAGLPFGDDDLSGQLYAARVLMLAFFAGAAALAYLSLFRLTGRRSVALAATLLAFSSYPLLYHSDMVATEGVMDLFAVLLAFHGVAVHARPCRSRRDGEAPIGQLVAKTCAALLLGWHVYGLLLPLLLVALPHAVGTRDWRRFRHCVLLGAAAVLTGLAVLAFNLAREHHALGGRVAFADLPSLRSMLANTSVVPAQAFVGWGAFLEDQCRRIGEVALPWVLAELLQGYLYGLWHWVGGVCVGLTVLLICLPRTRHRAAWSGLALCGIGWALPMRESVQEHQFEVLFHVGIPLVLGALLLTRLRLVAGRWRVEARVRGGAGGCGDGDGMRSRPDLPVPAAVVAAAWVLFVASAWSMAAVGDDAETRLRDRVVLADVREIRRHTQGKVVYAPRAELETNPCCRTVYFTRSIVADQPTPRADFVVGTDLSRAGRADRHAPTRLGDRSLTPRNRVVFLYEPDVYHAALTAARGVYEELVRTSQPVIAAEYAIHHVGGALVYVGEGDRCSQQAPGSRIFLHVYPVDLRVLPASRRREGFANLNVARDRHWQHDGRCFALAFLPSFAIGAIHTGEFAVWPPGGGGALAWEGRFSPGPRGGTRRMDEIAAAHRRSYERIAAGEPLARSTWDVYFLPADTGGGELALLKAPCAVGDTAARFFLHVVPADMAVLPPARVRYRFDNWDFDFRERGGTRIDDRCLVRARLPEYDIDAVRSGQYHPAAGVVWSVALEVPRAGAQP